MLDAASYATPVPGSVFVHLVGASHPAPWKHQEFILVDFGSLQESVKAAQTSDAGHFVYVSAAQPAPVMKAYIRVREQCEQLLRESRLNCTILRPWYVLGPGHRWPAILKPLYALGESIPTTRDSAQRLGLIDLDQMVRALVQAVEAPPVRVRVVEVPEMRAP